MSGLLHSPRPIPPGYDLATRDHAPDPVAWDLVMAHCHDVNMPPKTGDRPGLIGFGPSTSGKTSAFMVKLKRLRGDGYVIHHMSATELSTLVRESASDYRSFAAISRHLCGKGSDEDLADLYSDALGCHDSLERCIEMDKVRRYFPKAEGDSLFRRWFSCDGLFLDDLHIPKFTEAYARTLYDIIEQRTANFDALLLTSQLLAQELYDKWKNDSPSQAATAWAIINRIDQRCTPVPFVKGTPAPPAPPPDAATGEAPAVAQAEPSDASCANVEPNPEQKEKHHEPHHRPVIPQAGRDDKAQGPDLHARRDRTLDEQKGRGVGSAPFF